MVRLILILVAAPMLMMVVPTSEEMAEAMTEVSESYRLFTMGVFSTVSKTVS